MIPIVLKWSSCLERGEIRLILILTFSKSTFIYHLPRPFIILDNIREVLYDLYSAAMAQRLKCQQVQRSQIWWLSMHAQWVEWSIPPVK